MNFRTIAPAAILLAATAAFSQDFHRNVAVGAQPDVYVSTGSGNIRITPSSGSEIEVTGHLHAGWSAGGDVRSRIERIIANPPIQQTGNAIRIGETNDRALYNNISIDYEIKAPEGAALNIRSGSGDLEVNSVGRFLAASSGSGNVRAHQVHGPAELSSGSGDLELEEAAAGDVKARTGSGNIRIQGFDGSFNARSGSGDVDAAGTVKGASMVSTGSGNVRLHVAEQSRFNIEASTGSGSIRVHMPGAADTSTEHNRHHLTLAVNGGGPALSVRTGSGDIELAPR